MFVLEKPYASDVMLEWLESSRHPVLANAFACQLAEGGRALNLAADAEAAEAVASGERVYTCSENALDWVLGALDGAREQAASGEAGKGRPSKSGYDLARCIRLCKDKAAMRRLLADMDPALFFRECSMEELRALDAEELPFPLVVKPSVGFVSFGVHVARDAREWADALAALQAEFARGSVFPESVVGGERFVVEGFITGQEYAVDMYYDAAGEPVILDVMQHDFLDTSDTSDHLYYTSEQLMGRAVPALEAWFRAANHTLNFQNFCTHVELRVSHAEGADPLDAMADAANVHVIEFNPLRFAGYCGTDLGWYAYGIRTYEYYLAGKMPDWKAAAEAASSDDDAASVTAFVVLEVPTKGDAIDIEAFRRDLVASCEGLELCEMRPLDPAVHGLSAFPIVRIPAGADFTGFRQFALEVDADRYVRS